MGKSTISMAIFHSYFDITRGYGKYGARHLLGSQKGCRSIHLRSKTSLSTPELSVGAAQTFSGARNFREVGAQEVRCQQLCCLLAWQWSGNMQQNPSKSHIPMIDNWAFMMDILYVIFFDAGPICNMSASVGCLPVHRQRLDKSQTRPATACAVLNMAFSEARCHAAAGLKCFHVIGHRLKILILEDESTAGHDYCSSSTWYEKNGTLRIQ